MDDQHLVWQKGKHENPLLSAQQGAQGPVFNDSHAVHLAHFPSGDAQIAQVGAGGPGVGGAGGVGDGVGGEGAGLQQFWQPGRQDSPLVALTAQHCAQAPVLELMQFLQRPHWPLLQVSQGGAGGDGVGVVQHGRLTPVAVGQHCPVIPRGAQLPPHVFGGPGGGVGGAGGGLGAAGAQHLVHRSFPAVSLMQEKPEAASGAQHLAQAPVFG